MTRSITQRELRNASGEIMRGLDRGEAFLVTRNGVPVGELTPVRSRQFVAAGVAIATFATAPAVDPDQFRSDLDAALSQDTAPRA
jgi:antitoxin (DNA-binding transcriptional repressor) of toxin-antitoxin stability system